MLKKFMTGLLVTGLALASSAFAQGKQIKVGVIFDMSGALAAGGSNASYLGTKYAMDLAAQGNNLGLLAKRSDGSAQFRLLDAAALPSGAWKCLDAPSQDVLDQAGIDEIGRAHV